MVGYRGVAKNEGVGGMPWHRLNSVAGLSGINLGPKVGGTKHRFSGVATGGAGGAVAPLAPS